MTRLGGIMTIIALDPNDTLTGAALAAAEEIAPFPALEEDRERLLGLPRRLTRFGDVLAETLERILTELTPTDQRAAVRVSSLLLDVLLAEEGFSRTFWTALRRHLRLLHSAGRTEEGERRLRETLLLAAALG